MNRVILTLLGILLVGCIPVIIPPQLEPAQLTSALSRSEIISRINSTFIQNGFDIKVSDASGGIVQAGRLRVSPNNKPYVTCREFTYDPHNHDTEITVGVTVITKDNENTILIASRTVSSWERLPPLLRMSPSYTDCASSGEIEKLLSESLKQ